MELVNALVQVPKSIIRDIPATTQLATSVDFPYLLKSNEMYWSDSSFLKLSIKYPKPASVIFWQLTHQLLTTDSNDGHTS